MAKAKTGKLVKGTKAALAKAKKAIQDALKNIRTLRLSTGSSMLNLGLTDNARFGILSGHYYFFVGDSSSGKTWLVLNILAEAAYNIDFANYRLIYDDVEHGALMSVERFFGKKTADRIEAPREVDGLPVNSDTVEDLYDNLNEALKGPPFIYILDSQDALDSVASNDKAEEQRAARRKGKQTAGSYGDGKPKVHSENIRRIVRGLKKSGSILIIISQTRDNLGFGFETKTRSGGRALRFYATTEIWTSIKKKLKKEVPGGKIQVGIDCKIDLKKNRITGDEPTVVIPIMNNSGIDDTGAMVDYLVASEHWSESRGTIEATEFDFTGKRAKLVKLLEDNDEIPLLQNIVTRVWNETKQSVRGVRKSKYARMDERSSDDN
jgi:RecA/RadA recombinase